MFSLQFPLSTINNGFFSYCNQKLSSCFLHDRCLCSSRSLSRSYPFSIPLPKYHVCANSTRDPDVVFKGEEKGRVLSDAGREEEKLLPAGLRPELMPKHVAVIMDGNVRWAKKRNLPSSFGHKAGIEALRELVDLCSKWGISVLTVFVFSTENWFRTKLEVNAMMNLFERAMKEDLKCVMRNNIRVSVIGDSKKLPQSMQKLKTEVEELTRDNSGLQLIIAISYSGHYDIVQACRSIAEKTKDGEIQTNDITEAIIEQELETKCTNFPHPDLLIRTSGEQRISNFLLWQLAYTELAFVQSLWPDFGKDDLVDVLCSFQQRQRRYDMVVEIHNLYV